MPGARGGGDAKSIDADGVEVANPVDLDRSISQKKIVSGQSGLGRSFASLLLARVDALHAATLVGLIVGEDVDDHVKS